MGSVEIVNSEKIRPHIEGLDRDEIYDQIVSNASFEDLERHLEDDGRRVTVPVENSEDDGIDEIDLHPVTGKGEFEHYEEREFYTIAFEKEPLERYREEGLPELIPKEELLGNGVQGVYTVADNGHKAMMTDFEYRSNWRNKNRNEVEAIYEAAKKVYSAIDQGLDDTEIENTGYDVDVSSVKSELQDRLCDSKAHDYHATLKKLARIPHNANSGTTTGSTWGINDANRFIGHIDEENQKVVLEEIATHNTNKNSMNRRYGGDS
ncbi:MAG: hypothetical protein ABEK00_01035 [Candidatus Nanohaloarchaea archaeon]